ncbi:hypothetical protein N7478_007807 [Penicillium angulare]|uniref:uncharacterized protein n=1 Tax=Penicillium angulare TaxID=116970 RepID=UPI00253F7BAF|nr:uncharacterized protein N7478_007807 [Penicillium angulare]KAJ5272682.1 hypothetical protein N7478_007807 [Penicillium angulare]
MSLNSFNINSLYILLYIGHDPPQPNNFHWAFYFHRDHQQGGTKYHVKDIGQGWIADHSDIRFIMKEFLLVGLFKIADVPHGQEDFLDQTMRTFDDKLNTPETTCRVWILWVFDILQQPRDGQRILKSNDLAKLEIEIKEWGNQCAMSAARNEQPRPVCAPLLCGL